MQKLREMENITDVYLTQIHDSPYIMPYRLNYTHNGEKMYRDVCLQVQDRVVIVVFNVTRRAMVLVKQFRPAVYYNSIHPDDRSLTAFIDTKTYPPHYGITLELCGGNASNTQKSLKEVAKDIVLQEGGYDAPLENFEQLYTYKSLIRIGGPTESMFYCEVTDEMKREDETRRDDYVEVVEKNISQIEEILQETGYIASPADCLFGIQWFLYNKSKQFKKSFEYNCGSCKERLLQA